MIRKCIFLLAMLAVLGGCGAIPPPITVEPPQHIARTKGDAPFKCTQMLSRRLNAGPPNLATIFGTFFGTGPYPTGFEHCRRNVERDTY